MINWIRKEARNNKNIGAICTATYILAKAGLLDNSKSTIHWENQEALKEDFGDLDITESIYTIDKRKFTSAGGTASLDLMLKIIAEDFNTDLAKLIADQMLHDSIRTEMDKQLPSTPNRIGARNPKILTAIIALVLEVIKDSTCLRLMQKLSISISANIG